MYEPFNNKNGAAAVGDEVGAVTLTPDGVTFAQRGDSAGSLLIGNEVLLPERLRAWLIDLHLLRHIPLSYLAPDAGLLPPESVRFFYVDPTWIDRVVDGALAAGNTGTADAAFGYQVLLAVRRAIDADLGVLARAQPGTAFWRPGVDPITGMLMRSEAVRRWPDMIVRAFAAIQSTKDGPRDKVPLAILRAEPISKDIYIALFAGQPQRVELREPNVGMRFGVEAVNEGSSGPPYHVNRRNRDGTNVDGVFYDIKLDEEHHVIDATSLARLVAADNPDPPDPNPTPGGRVTLRPIEDPSSRDVALHLEQRPYVQVFQLGGAVQESRGSVDIDSDEAKRIAALRSGRTMNTAKLRARLARTARREEI